MSLMLVMKSRLIKNTGMVPHHVVLYKRCTVEQSESVMEYVTWLETADSTKSHDLNGDRCWGYYRDTPTEGLQDFLDRCKKNNVEPELWGRC